MFLKYKLFFFLKLFIGLRLFKNNKFLAIDFIPGV